jgi:hypothetical protein
VKLAYGVTEVHPILTPAPAVIEELVLLAMQRVEGMRDLERLRCTGSIRCS